MMQVEIKVNGELLVWFNERNKCEPKISANYVKFEMRNFVDKFGEPN